MGSTRSREAATNSSDANDCRDCEKSTWASCHAGGSIGSGTFSEDIVPFSTIKSFLTLVPISGSVNQKFCNSCGEKLSAFFVLRSVGAATRSPCQMALKYELSENISQTSILINTREPQHRCFCSLTRVRKFFQIQSVQRPPKLAYIGLKNGRTGTDNCHGALDGNDFHLQPFTRFVLGEFCSDLPASKTHFLLLEGQEEQTSSVRQDRGGCLLVVVPQDES